LRHNRRWFSVPFPAFPARASVPSPLRLAALLAIVAGCTVSTRGLTTVVPGDETDGAGTVDESTAEDVPDDPDRSAGDPADRPPTDRAPGAVPDGSAERPPADSAPDEQIDARQDIALPPGVPCAVDGTPCASGFCVDGICCNTSCEGACQACSAGRTGAPDGLCRSIPAGTDPDTECTDDGAASCGRTGHCDGNGACALYTPGTTCGVPSCAGSTLTAAPTCDAKGTCRLAQPMPCPGGFACLGNQTCLPICTVDANCAAGRGCNPATGACSVLKKAQGQRCNTAAECVTGNCTDGVCCNFPCAGRCQACRETATGSPDGTCANVMAGLAPSRPGDCPTQTSPCGNSGLCSGAGACQQIPDGTRCGTYCCGQGQDQTSVCHLVCQAGACNDQSGLAAGTCDDGNACTSDRCNDMVNTHTCAHTGACTGMDSCCCVAPGIGGPFCAEPDGCTDDLGGTCGP
jgi:hypothetical protein